MSTKDHVMDEGILGPADATGLRDLIRDAGAAVPQRIEGIDRTGAVRIVTGVDGVPESIEVVPEWRRHLRPPALAAAIVEAADNAAYLRRQAWSLALADPDLQRHARPGHSAARWARDAADRARELLTAAPAPSREVTAAVAPSPGAAAAAPSPDAAGTGAGSSGRLRLTIGVAGDISCTADPLWLRERGGVELTKALTVALCAARAELSGGQRAGTC